MPKFFAKRAGTAGGHRTIIVALACSAGLLAAGCSALRLTYGQAPDLSYWWADKYLDFDDQQEPRVREALQQWFAWHRASQLPDYASQLTRAQAEVQQPVTAEQACRWYGVLQARVDTAFAQALPAMARLAVDVKPEQLSHMAKRFEKLNADFADEVLDEPAEEQRERAAKRLRDRYETLFGSLNDPQREVLEAAVASLPLTPAVWDAERRLRQQDTLVTLQRLSTQKPSPEAAQSQLQALFERAKHSPRAAYRARQQQAVQGQCALFAQVHALSSPAQRTQAAKKLQGWEEDARSLTTASASQPGTRFAGLAQVLVGD